MNVTYYSLVAIAARYGLSAELAVKLAGIDPLTGTLIAQSCAGAMPWLTVLVAGR
jgi:hypothetical protein